MIKLHFEKLSRFDRKNEPVSISVPFKEGAVTNIGSLVISDGKNIFHPQARPLSSWPDGSVKWLHLVFPADLPGNKAKDYFLMFEGVPTVTLPRIETDAKSLSINAGALKAALAKPGNAVFFDALSCGTVSFLPDEISLPLLTVDGRQYQARIDGDWNFIEDGPFRVIAGNSGKHYSGDGTSMFDFDLELHFTAGSPWFKIVYCFTNAEKDEFHNLEGLSVNLNLNVNENNTEAKTAMGIPNYYTDIKHGDSESSVRRLIDAEFLMYDGNEQIPETLYGTFFADWRIPGKGICATIYQAPQNFPKALCADKNGISVELMPSGYKPLKIMRGMAKTHTVFFHLHDGNADINELSVRSLQMQMPDRPALEQSVYAEAGVFENVFVSKPIDEMDEVESFLTRIADATGFAYGMISWGDYPDMGYTRQGRGEGSAIWLNNEYDIPHSYMLMYARSGERRFMDKMLVAAGHLMDIDICHSSDDLYRIGAQISHSKYHVAGFVSPCHEWVEGLLDYYHVTGDRRGLDSAVGIGENVLLLLPWYMDRETSARETGWALRSLCALYAETNDEKWLSKCELIVDNFDKWKNKYGAWIEPYTAHTLVRVPFMIAIAASSLIRYYRVSPSERIRNLIVDAMDDLIENAMNKNGDFYYKELPSLRFTDACTTVMEPLAYAYELTGDMKYLEAGVKTFKAELKLDGSEGTIFDKNIIEDSVVSGGASPKVFGMSHIPTAIYYKRFAESGLAEKQM